MKKDVGDFPMIGETARPLGVRRGIDILVKPQTGGMSVSLDSPFHLPRHGRPAILGGTGKGPSARCLSLFRLQSRPDPLKPDSWFY